jgi:hypothetical protein
MSKGVKEQENIKQYNYHTPPSYPTTRNYTPYVPIKGTWVPEVVDLGVYKKGHYVWTGSELGKI